MIVRDPDLSNNDEVYVIDIVLDTDGDSVLNSYQGIVDNCLATANPGQEDKDGDGLGDVCDSDLDGDAVLNVVDNCPNVSNPLQADFDSDAVGDHCDHSDGDGFLDFVELYVGTSPTEACGQDAWPADFDNDKSITILDVLELKASFNSTVGDPEYVNRDDLNADGSIDILDVLNLRPSFATSCV